MMEKAKKIPHCRMCRGKNLKKVIDLGFQPPANSFITKRNLKKKELYFPLKVNYCLSCGQLQLTHSVSPDLLFKDYIYASSTSPVFIKHFEDYAKNVFKELHLARNYFVIDIGSNDGILLKPFKKLGLRILGVDPAAKIAKKASKNGVETLPYYFTEEFAGKIIKKYGKADVITANNVFAHVPNLDELVRAVYLLLKPEGVFIIEAPYLVDFLEKNLFDTIYHEHVSYISIRPLIGFFKRFSMEIFDVRKVESHGGSVRIFIKKQGSNWKNKASVKKFLDIEKKTTLHKLSTYISFSKRIEINKKSLLKMLRRLKKRGKRIVGYGAPAKGNTLLNYFGIGNNLLDYIVDDSKYKQGLYTPGQHIPVVSQNILKRDNPDYILILAWNFAKPIMERLSENKKKGINFVIPVPRPLIV